MQDRPPHTQVQDRAPADVHQSHAVLHVQPSVACRSGSRPRTTKS